MPIFTPFIKRLTITFCLITILLAPIHLVSAQSDEPRLSDLAVELWPDYDRPAMLVLLTATLPEGTTLPAGVTIPLPTGAEVHAVASFNETGALMSDVDYTIEGDRLSLTTPSNRFRVEYYAPYAADGNEHSYTFNWVSDLIVDQATVVVQQPLAATDMRLTPAAASAVDRGDGQRYHTLAARSIDPGEPFTVEVAYTVDTPALSAPTQAPIEATEALTPAAGSATGIGFDPIWLLVGAGALALAGGAWYVGHRQGRAATRSRKPQPSRPEKKASSAGKPPTSKSTSAKPTAGTARYCHNCGRQAQAEDTFCRNCGEQLKG